MAAASALLCSWMPVQKKRPTAFANVLLIVLDDLGIENLGFYGYNPQGLDCSGTPVGPLLAPPTPRMAQLAQDGVRFSRAYANPACSTTRATILTGRYAFRTGMGNLSDRSTDIYSLSPSEWTIPRVLKNSPQGVLPHACGAFGKWHLSHAFDYTHPVALGFDQFVGTMTNDGNSNPDHFNWDKVEADVNGYTLEPVGGQVDESTYSASVVRGEAAAWITAVSEPFFAYVCFNPPHAPMQVPPYSTLSPETVATINDLEALATGLQYEAGHSYAGNTAEARLAYEWMIESVDTEIGRLVDSIPASKRAHTTILIVGDNGTPKQVIQEPPYRRSHAKGTAFEQGARVPFLACGYQVSTAGLTHAGVVHTVDLLQTIAALTGATLPAGLVEDSVGLAGVLENPDATSPRTTAFVQYFEPSGPYVPDDVTPSGKYPHWRATSDGTFKYMRFDTVSGPLEAAFRLSTDPTECTNLLRKRVRLAPEEQGRIDRLKDALIELSGF